jgi:hypothetical protein
MLNPYESPHGPSNRNSEEEPVPRGPQHMLIVTIIGVAILSIGICVLVLFG